MAKQKEKASYVAGKTEGGSGGKRGHSNMNHWGKTPTIKASARIARRVESKKLIREALIAEE